MESLTVPQILEMTQQETKRLTESFERLDRAEVILAQMPQVECPVSHSFTPGLYQRTFKVPAGTIVTSKIHMTEHPYVMTEGLMLVWIEGKAVTVRAPCFGVTKPGTRRLAYAIEDTVWTTFHVTDETDVDKIEEQIIFKHDAHLKGLVAQPSIEGKQ